MRFVIVGQQAFGKAVLEAFIAEVAGVFATREWPRNATRPANNASVTVSFAIVLSLRSESAIDR
jgi:hypothetical protein